MLLSSLSPVSRRRFHWLAGLLVGAISVCLAAHAAPTTETFNLSGDWGTIRAMDGPSVGISITNNRATFPPTTPVVLMLSRWGVSELGKWDKLTTDEKRFFQALRGINLDYTHGDGSVMNTLSRLSQLQLLSFQEMRIRDDDVLKLNKLTEVTNLNIGRTKITDRSLPVLKNMPKIFFLSLAQTRTDGSGFKYLSGLKHLRDLNLDRTYVTDDAIKYLVPLPALANLDLSGTLITEKGIKLLPSIRNLNSLTIGKGIKLTGDALAPLQRSKLTILHVLESDISDYEAKVISKIPLLSEVDLRFTNVGSPGVIACARMKHLNKIALDSTRVDDKAMPALARAQGLRCLRLNDCRVTDAGLKDLEQCRSLQYIALMNTAATDAGIARLQKSLPNCRIEH